MMDMIERAAEALYMQEPWAQHHTPLGAPKPWGEIAEEGKVYYRIRARAVLQAIREPSEAMLDEAEGKECIDPRATARHMWQAMIDAALAEAP